MKHLLLCISLSIFLALLSTDTIAAPEKKLVFVSILPQKSFVQHISGELVEVEVMVEPGANPVTYEPKPSQMRNLARCQAYFAIGVPFENVWLERIAAVNPDMPIVHTDKTITKIAMKSHVHGDREHHEDQHPEHGSLDPHIWLSPPLVKKQAAVIFAGLVELYPEHAESFTVNYHDFIDKVDLLHSRLKRLLSRYHGREFMVFHPSWGYFAKEYNLEQIAIEIEGKHPKPAQVQQLINYAKKENIRVIFAQQQFSLKSARIIAREIGGEVVTVDPLAEDWFANMEQIGQKFLEAMP